MNLRFAYWIPNINGESLTSNIFNNTNWNFDCNTQLAQTAEIVGFEYALSQSQFIDKYGMDCQLQALTTAVGLSKYTQRMKAIASVHPGLWHPGTVAKMASTIDLATSGRFCLNVVTNGFSDEFLNQRYNRCEEFIRIIKGMWTEDKFQFNGDFYCVNSSSNKPQMTILPHPEIFLGGNSKSARRLAARVSDWYFLNGNNIEGVREQIAEVSGLARRQGRRVKFALNAFAVVRDNQSEAHEVLEDIIIQAEQEKTKKFTNLEKFNRRLSQHQSLNKRWMNSDFSDLVEYSDGFKTGLVGTPEQVAEKIYQYQKVGVEMILCNFWDYNYDLPAFGKNVIPLVRQMEADNLLEEVAA
jgi:dimethylsulfone monooxygenase